jgi:signal recognition particle subunit SRP54
MFNQLSDNLENVFRKLRGLGKISEKNVTDALREVRLALLEADVDLQVARDFIDRIKDKALGHEVMRSVTPGQQIVKIFHDELTQLLGGDASPLNLAAPGIILMVGLNGVGKTTTSGKLAFHLKKAGRRPVLVACDLFRPAAIEQLATLGRAIDVPVFTPAAGEKNVIKVAKEALVWAKEKQATVIIVDTAGRQEIDQPLVRELKELRDFLQPKEVLLVADAATGQQAVSVARHFDEAVGVTGLILTKLDGDARGGAALSMREVTKKPIKFAGTGEKIEQLEAFVPDRMAGRILGMGDVVSLVEKAAEEIKEEEALKMAKRMTSQDFNFNDFLDQIRFMQRLGPLEGLLGMLPGMKQLKGAKVDEKRIKHIEALILSMTPKERRKPEIINGRRRIRISKGAGRTVAELNNLLKQFGEMRKLMKNKGKMRQLMGMMGGGGGFPGMGGMPGGGGGLPFR